jgi:thioredoxin
MAKVLTEEEFKEKVFDYENEQKWSFKGNKPALIDFYADWCGPCKYTGPILDEIDKERDDIDVYKIDVEASPNVSGAFGISGIPTFLFVPVKGEPKAAQGALSKEVFEKAIDNYCFNDGGE